jgi:hypothetical protein
MSFVGFAAMTTFDVTGESISFKVFFSIALLIPFGLGSFDHQFLGLLETLPTDNGWMAVFYVVHGNLTFVPLLLKIFSNRFLEEHIPYILFVPLEHIAIKKISYQCCDDSSVWAD